jgi:hypothetical protein
VVAIRQSHLKSREQLPNFTQIRTFSTLLNFADCIGTDARLSLDFRQSTSNVMSVRPFLERLVKFL